MSDEIKPCPFDVWWHENAIKFGFLITDYPAAREGWNAAEAALRARLEDTEMEWHMAEAWSQEIFRERDALKAKLAKYEKALKRIQTYHAAWSMSGRHEVRALSRDIIEIQAIARQAIREEAP